MEEDKTLIWHKVFATFEEPQDLAMGPWLGDSFPGVALPCRAALGKWIKLRFGVYSTFAQVVDVGPFCIDDQSYIFGTDRPRAEKYKGKHCPYSLTHDAEATLPDGTIADISNGSGIDLFPRIAKELGLDPKINPTIEWKWMF